jgi:hypothetical protein
MKKLRNFKCNSTGYTYEKLVKDDIITILCKCNSKAIRVISAPKFINSSCGKNASWS